MKRLGLLIVVLVSSYSAYTLWQEAESSFVKVNDADAMYAKGETATTLDERKRAFNQALHRYKQLENDNHPDYGTGKLYYNIGNSYFQLEQYPWAALYYYRALSLRPRDGKIKHNLNVTLKKLELEVTSKPSVFDRMFFFHHKLSLPERLQLVALFALLVIVFGSIQYWIPGRWVQRGLVLSILLSSIMLLSVGYTRYIESPKGVLVKSTHLYRDAGKQYALVSDEPVLSGNRVEILDVAEDGMWLKVMTADGVVGYVPFESIRTVR